MANIRVHELARDLNMTNKVLLSKLSEMDIDVKSHMSTLDNETVAKVKSALFGKKGETVEETRVKPTVIRRRKKQVQVEAVSEPTPELEEIAAAEEPAEQAAEVEEKKREEEPPKKKKAAKKEAAAAEVPTVTPVTERADSPEGKEASKSCQKS